MTDTQYYSSNWIYSLADYQRIFALPKENQPIKILDFPGRISSVNAELSAQGVHIVSGDNLYQLSPNAMQQHVKKILKEKIDFLQRNLHMLTSPDEKLANQVISDWQKSAELFLDDYELGKKQGRYQAMHQPRLIQDDQPFDLLLCADFFFHGQNQTISAQELMNQLCLLAIELRIFPISDEKKNINTELGPLMLALQQRNFGVEVKAVNFPQRSNGHAMLRIWANECQVKS